ncbi:hypothetical protein J6590_092353 [Homalodisca vitripennis]|nr:hypothetical protein J6590_092353 [Homalodisca vitripennis]
MLQSDLTLEKLDDMRSNLRSRKYRSEMPLAISKGFGGAITTTRMTGMPCRRQTADVRVSACAPVIQRTKVVRDTQSYTRRRRSVLIACDDDVASESQTWATLAVKNADLSGKDVFSK